MNEQINSISINNFDDSGNINSEKRIFSNSDLDKTNNEGEIKQTNTINNNSISDDAININNNVNNNINNNVNDNEISEEEKENEKFHKDFIQELKNNKYIFIKDYPEQEVNELNVKYINWLKNLYKKNFFSEEKKYINKLINNKKLIIDYHELYLKIKNNLFFCNYPKCKSIIYISDTQKNKLEKIQNLRLNDFDYDKTAIFFYQKIRCPLCLKYKCIFCNKLSTCKFNYCCFYQAFKACYESERFFNDNVIKFCIYTPFVRIWYFGFMISYPLFRLLTRPENLLQSKNSIIRKRSSGMHIKEALGLYTKYFECNCRNINLTNIFHIFGSIIWTFPYMILFEVILIFFMIISYIFNKQYYIKFMNCFYNFSFLPV